MEKKICSYETLFAVNGNFSEEDYAAVKDKFVALINDNGSDIEVNEWGKRKFAYPINYVTEGYYVLISFKSEPAFPLELNRVFGITEGILRFIVTDKIEKPVKAAPAVKAEETAPVDTAVAE